MTKIIAKIDAFDMRDSDLSGMRDYLHHSLSSTEARYYNNANNYNSIVGTDLSYDTQDHGLFMGGTITAIHNVAAGTERLSATGFSLDAWDFEGLLRANDLDGLWDSILAGNDVIRGSNDTVNGDYLVGNAGNDRIYGNAGDDTLKGETGNDKLFGGKGDDHLFGGLGNDRLDGGKGNFDLLSGGAGRDSFVFRRPS